MTKKALIDADIVAYTAAHATCTWVTNDDGEDEAWPDVGAAGEFVDEIVRAWTRHSGADEPVCVLSPDDRTNYRLLVWPAYKTHRKSSRKPPHLGEVIQYIRDRWDGYHVPYLEGDDVLGILHTRNPDNTVIVSTDKDMHTVPGWHYNPNKDEGSGPRYVCPMMADRWLQTQVLTGDSTDGYKGAKGIGPKKAETVLNNHYVLERQGDQFVLKGDPAAAWEDVMNTFRVTGQPLDEAVQNLAMARILHTDLFRKTNGERFIQLPTETWGVNTEFKLPCTS